MVGEACLPSNAYYPRTPDYTLCSAVHVCWSEHSDSSFVYGFMSLDYGFVTMIATTYYNCNVLPLFQDDSSVAVRFAYISVITTTMQSFQDDSSVAVRFAYITVITM